MNEENDLYVDILFFLKNNQFVTVVKIKVNFSV